MLTIALLAIFIAHFQNTVSAVIKDATTNETLIGATAMVQGTQIGATTDTTGRIMLFNIPEAIQIILFSYLRYLTQTDTLRFSFSQSEPVLILLQKTGKGDGEELKEVVIGATLSSRTLANMPTRAEVISGDELDEKGDMKPDDIRMMLAEAPVSKRSKHQRPAVIPVSKYRAWTANARKSSRMVFRYIPAFRMDWVSCRSRHWI